MRLPYARASGGLFLGTATALSITALLGGCWSAPRVDVQPTGEPHTIQEGIVVVSTVDHQIVRTVDARTRVLTISDATGGLATACDVPRSAAGLEHLQSGDRVRLQLTAALRIYVATPALAPPSARKHSSAAFEGRVLAVDPSYRLLTAVFGDGRIETFKVGLNAKLRATQPGTAVSMRCIDIARIQRRGA